MSIIRRLSILPAVVAAGTVSFAQSSSPNTAAAPLVERVGDTGFIQLQADSFRQLDARHQALAYWLTQAAIAIDPIIYDQLSAYGIREKRLFEHIVAHPAGIAPDTFAKVRAFALLFWANRGNHNENTSQKFLPGFTFDELRQAAMTAQKNGAFRTGYADLPPLATEADLERELAALRAPLFDPAFEPMLTVKTSPPGQ